MAKVHNKKRNIGIIYEQVIQYICNRLLENDEEVAKKGIAIIKESFKEGTQLNKEYRLFKALATTKNVSEHLAGSIINEAKKACNYHFDNKVLEEEKSILIHNLNKTFGKGVIFEENVKNYRIYATIQTLLNEWRSPSNNFDRITEFEIKLHESLIEKQVMQESKEYENIKFDKMTYGIMKKIFNEKYNSILSENQKELIQYYTNNDDNKLIEHCKKIKTATISELDRYIVSCDNKIVKSKYQDVKNNIVAINESNIDKSTLKKFLTISKLKEELSGE